MIPRAEWTAAVCVLTVAFGASCIGGLICTNIGCDHTVDVDVVTTELASGTYDIELRGTEDVVSCHLEVPVDADSTRCSGWDALTLRDDRLEVQLRDYERPDEVHFTIQQQGEEIASGTATIDWQDQWFPNGARCGDGCWRGTAEVAP